MAVLLAQGLKEEGHEVYLARRWRSNAVKYSRQSGDVSITLRGSQNEFHLEVSDSGPGMAESEVPRIFERFYRAPEARSSTQPRYGLGL